MNIFWIALIALSQHAQHHNPQHSFEDTDRWVEEFENDERDAQQRPDEVVRALNLTAGDVVADIGAGTGYFTRRFAKAVGDTGTAYAVDLEPNMLKYVAERAEKDGQPNIGDGDDDEPFTGTELGRPLLHLQHDPPHRLARPVLQDSGSGPSRRWSTRYRGLLQGHRARPRAVSTNAHREKGADSRGDGGRLAIVDFYKDIELDQGPSRQMRIAKKALIAEVTAAGFRLVEEHDFLPVQYFVVFEAP